MDRGRLFFHFFFCLLPPSKLFPLGSFSSRTDRRLSFGFFVVLFIITFFLSLLVVLDLLVLLISFLSPPLLSFAGIPDLCNHKQNSKNPQDLCDYSW